MPEPQDRCKFLRQADKSNSWFLKAWSGEGFGDERIATVLMIPHTRTAAWTCLDDPSELPTRDCLDMTLLHQGVSALFA